MIQQFLGDLIVSIFQVGSFPNRVVLVVLDNSSNFYYPFADFKPLIVVANREIFV